MSSLEVEVEPIEGVEAAAVVRLRGVLDQPTLKSFLSRLEAVRNDGKVRVLLDMEGVSYANSTALGALVTQADAFREGGGELALLNLQPKVHLVIDMLGLSALFRIFTSLEAGRSYLASGAVPSAAVAEAPAGAAQQEPGGAPRAPTQARPFPVRAECIGCRVALEFSQPGHFRCPRCAVVYSVGVNGRVAGSKARGGHAIEFTLNCHPRSLEAFEHFVGALPAWDRYSEDERARLESAVAEVCDAIHQKAYGGDDESTFHVLIVSRRDELALRIADHGEPLEPSAFPIASDYMTEFGHRPHPTRGNLLKMTKRAE